MRKIPPLNALKAFEATARLGTVQKASEELCVTHGAISRHIKQLESWLGVTMFDRSQRSVSLNSAGKSYLKTISTAFDLVHEASQSIQQNKSANTLGIATTHSIANKWLMERLPDFYERHPEIEVWMSLDQRLVDFESSAVDVGIRMGNGKWPELCCERLMSDQLIPVCSPNLLRNSNPLNQIEDLKHYTLLHDQDPSAQWKQWFDAHKVEFPDVTKGPRYTSGDIVINSAISGQGMALVSEILAARDIAEQRLIQALPQTLELGDYFWLVTSNEKRSNPVVEAFYQWMLQQCH